ncbi:uncharacterized protein BO66DRAFT_434791 [Aspergillus aculeatinus CBS 121060]|uniref:Uncharacterized protein n=1 Tax=Aspergillus aculeatinus CBS 121060 TaxID=1448322 RepID=A0ACD1HK71_9EURO|nr:hypothetical protein BO66DRAFT_434791 [Aspergillus aculeatinus CBS 121060]RAH73797.1 hypothetical protein BO66DRAFT_434791 [Aspergillus aculeatinus CBS 121060]
MTDTQGFPAWQHLFNLRDLQPTHCLAQVLPNSTHLRAHGHANVPEPLDAMAYGPFGTALSPGAVPYLVDPWGTHTHSSLHTLASGPSGQNINTIPAVVETRRRVRDQISFPTQTRASGSGSSNIFKEAMPEPPTSRILTSGGGCSSGTKRRRSRQFCPFSVV